MPLLSILARGRRGALVCHGRAAVEVQKKILTSVVLGLRKREESSRDMGEITIGTGIWSCVGLERGGGEGNGLGGGGGGGE